MTTASKIDIIKTEKNLEVVTTDCAFGGEHSTVRLTVENTRLGRHIIAAAILEVIDGCHYVSSVNIIDKYYFNPTVSFDASGYGRHALAAAVGNSVKRI